MIHGGAAQESYSSDWLRALGYNLEVNEDDGWVWASLRPRANPELTVPKYGRGRTRGEAIESAAQRWRVEKIGNDNERKPREPPP